jgi:SAM-dependent methyltransferase
MESTYMSSSVPPIKSRHKEAYEDRKRLIREHADQYAADRLKWKEKMGYFHDVDLAYMRFLIPEGTKILDLGCGKGDLLAALKPAIGVGVDLSPEMIKSAKVTYSKFTFYIGDIENPLDLEILDGGPFDYIILSDIMGSLEDCQATLENLHQLCGQDTRVIISYYAHIWQPLLGLAERLGLKMPQVEQNYLPIKDISNLLSLSDFDVVKQERRILLPVKLLGLGPLVNRYLSFMPLLRNLAIRNYTIARSNKSAPMAEQSVSIIVPCRNEKGNIEAALERLPKFGKSQELIFIEGHSNDGTYEEIERVAKAYDGEIKIRYARQDGIGKGDAMRKGYALAKNDILMILDADLTVAPEALPKFYNALVSGKGNFINGSRLVYPMDNDAMRFLNLIANSAFARLFSWLLNQDITDTLCGTKVLSRAHYDLISANRHYFGDFDPFGDFDLIFGAAKQHLRIVDIPIRYAGRSYGETQISRFRHGVLLIRMVFFAYRKLAAI